MNSTKIRIFVMMPFDPSFNDVYKIIRATIKEVNEQHGSEFIICERIDEIEKPGIITDDIKSKIEESNICITDVTGNNANVMYETGLATALNKSMIFLTQKIDELPFDIKTIRVIKYTLGNMQENLKNTLQKFIKNILPELKPISDRNSNDIFWGKSIFVTGSMQVDVNRLQRRLEQIMLPYLGRQVEWYIGSFGMVDEMVIDYLCSRKEKVFIIGYHEYDISNNIHILLKKYNLKFIIPQYEQFIKSSVAISERDTYAANKTNLAIIFWDHKSEETKTLIEWYHNNGKDFLLGFC